MSEGLDARRAELVRVMTAAGKAPSESDRERIIATMPVETLDALIEHYSAPIHVG